MYNVKKQIMFLLCWKHKYHGPVATAEVEHNLIEIYIKLSDLIELINTWTPNLGMVFSSCKPIQLYYLQQSFTNI